MFCKFGQSSKFGVKLVISSWSVFDTFNYCEIDNTFYWDEGFDKMCLVMFLFLYLVFWKRDWFETIIYVYCGIYISHNFPWTRLLIIVSEFILLTRDIKNHFTIHEKSVCLWKVPLINYWRVYPSWKKRLFMESSLA